jgi:hypothetical protein
MWQNTLDTQLYHAQITPEQMLQTAPRLPHTLKWLRGEADLCDDARLNGLQFMAQQLAEAVGVVCQLLIDEHLERRHRDPGSHGVAAVGAAVLPPLDCQHHLPSVPGKSHLFFSGYLSPSSQTAFKHMHEQ